MGIKRSVDINSYMDDEDEVSTNSVGFEYEEEDENEAPSRSSMVQTGWAEAKKAAAKVAAKYANDFKFEEEVQLIKFLTSEPMIFSQHWVERKGKRSFICPGTPQCPLCRAGNSPESKFAFSVVNLSAEVDKDEDEDMQVLLMTVGVKLVTQLEKLNNDPKTGPLDRLYWAVSKSGSGGKTSYTIMSVKDRDLAEDWEINPAEVAAALRTLKPVGPESLRPEPMEELKKIAREIPED